MLAWLVVPTSAWAAHELTLSPSESTDGVVKVSWSDGTPESTGVELQIARSADFDQAVTLYRGSDRATTLSGLSDGEYFLRVGNDQNWSSTGQLSVAHHSLASAFVAFGIGLLIFMSIIAAIWRGHRTDSQSGPPCKL